MYMAPVAVIFLLPAALFMEEGVVGITVALARDDWKFLLYLTFNSALAYFVNLTNFLVTKHTSPLTLQVFLSVLKFYANGKEKIIANKNIFIKCFCCWHIMIAR